VKLGVIRALGMEVEVGGLRGGYPERVEEAVGSGRKKKRESIKDIEILFGSAMAV